MIWGFAAETATAGNPVEDPEDPVNPITDGRTWQRILSDRLDILLERGRLEAGQVLALLDTHYVNPPGAGGRALALVSTNAQDPATCRARDLSIAGLDAAAAVRIARIMRLSKRSGLTPREIDQAMRALGTADLDEAFLHALSRLVALRARIGTRWQALCAMLIPLAPARLARYWHPVGAERSVDHGTTRCWRRASTRA